MARITRAAAHLSIEEVKNRMRTDPRPLYRQRWLIIYNALAQPRKAEEIARHCGVSKATVQKAHFNLQSIWGSGGGDAWQGRPSSPVSEVGRRRAVPGALLCTCRGGRNRHRAGDLAGL